MSRYLQPVCKRCRRLNQKLFLKGYKCFTNCVMDKNSGEKTKIVATKKSDYAMHLREKQIARLSLQMNEAQFKRFFSIASRTKGKTGETLLRLLEMRLDNIVRRAGFCDSIKMARQLVNHGHVKVNNRCIDIPSYIVREGDEISLAPHILEKPIVKQSLENTEKASLRPSFISYNPQTFTAKIVRNPDRSEFSTKVNEQLIVEFYSK